MSKKKTKNGNMDLDDALGDLLGTDDDVPARKVSPTVGRTARFSRGAPVRRAADDTYSKLAAMANSDLSVSDTDPAEVLKQLEDMDDMDDALFGKKTPAAKKDTPAKDSPKSQNSTKKKKPPSIDFDDDDPLAGLSLSDIDDDDDDDVKPKKPALTSAVKKPTTKTQADNDESLSQESNGSRRLEIDRPPTRSGSATKDGPEVSKKPVAARKRDDDMFADDDDLGGLLDSPGRTAPVKPSAVKKKDGGIMDDLLGKANVDKLLQKPGNGAGVDRQFKLDKKYTKSAVKSQKAAVKEDDDFLFGSYSPSAAVTPAGSRPSSVRAVRFENEKAGAEDPPRTSTSAPPGGRRRSSPSSRLGEMLLEDKRDWLDMAVDDHNEAGNDEPDSQPRPQSAGGQPHTTSEGKSKSDKSEPVDWLGLSRLGSPDNTPDEPDYRVPKPTTEKTQSVRPKDHTVNSAAMEKEEDDLLGVVKARRARKASSPLRNKEANWLEEKDEKVSNWLGMQDTPLADKGEDQDFSSRVPQSPTRVSATGKPDVNLFIPPPISFSDDESPFKWGTDRDRPRSRRTERTPPAEGVRTSTEVFGEPIDGSLKPEPVTQYQRQSQPPVQQSGVSQPAVHQPGVSQPTSGASQTTRTDVREQQIPPASHKDQPAMYAASHLYQDHIQRQPILQTARQPSLPMVTSDDMSQSIQIRRLEMERGHLEMMLTTLTEQHTVEYQMMEDSYRKRTNLMEETFARREERLKEEIESISRQGSGRMKMLETEKGDLLASHSRREEEWEREKTREVERIKELHRDAVMEMRRQHEYAMERLKKMKDSEVDAIASTQTHTRSLQAVMEKMEENMQDLSSLQMKVDSRHETSLDLRETAAKTRDDALKSFQDRLERQQHANEIERARLEGLVSTLEKQLTDQSRELEEEHWKVRQEEAKLRSLQHTVTQEKDVMQERHLRDRTEIEKAKDRLIEEQQRIMGELYKERQALAEDKTKFLLEQKLTQDKEHRDSLKHLKADADFSSTVKVINDEKAKLLAEERELTTEKERLKGERALLERLRGENESERVKLQQMALQVQQESEAMDSVSKETAHVREHAEAMLAATRKKEDELLMRGQRLQQDMDALRMKEKSIVQEKLTLAKDKQDLEQSRSNILCVNCRTPVRERAPPQHGAGPPFQAGTNAVSLHQMTPAAQKLFASLPPEFQSHLESMNDVSAAIATDRTIRMWKIAAEKDKAFLEGEDNFLEMLKYTPYHSAPSPRSPVPL